MIWSDSLLDGGLKYLLFSPQMGEMIQVDEHSFQIDRDLQLLQLTPWKIHRSTGDILIHPQPITTWTRFPRFPIIHPNV